MADVVFKEMTLITRIILFFLLSVPTYSMEFRWGRIDETKGPARPAAKEVIYLTGDIRIGDYERFRSFLLKDFDSYLKSMRYIHISSNGGDIVEAITIGQLLRKMYAEVYIPPDANCASACFLLYVSAVERSSHGKVGVHRPYFERRYFAGLSPSNAEKRQLELTKALNAFLEQNYVPKRIIDRMNATSSKKIYWLKEDDLDDLGRYSNWYEEFLLAKCKRAPSFWETIDLILDREKEFAAFNDCKENVIQPELQGKLRQTLANPTKQ